MNYVEYGLEQKDTIIFLHGGGLAPWNYFGETRHLQDEYHIVIPVLDGHNGSDQDFTSIESNADEIIDFIDQKFSGQVLLIGGLSLGGQILIEMLSKRKDICKYAIIESALVLPMKATYALIKPTFSLCYPLVKRHWFAQVQFNSLHIKKELFDNYYRDSAAITKANMIAFLKANSDYKLKREIEECKSKVLVLVGSKESGIMKKSADILHERIQNSTLETLPGYYHGDLSINHSDIYIRKMKQLIAD